MTELVIVIVLCGLMGWIEYNNRKERGKYLNALMSRTNQEFVNAELADKTKVEVKSKEQGDELVPLSELNDEEFLDTIAE